MRTLSGWTLAVLCVFLMPGCVAPIPATGAVLGAKIGERADRSRPSANGSEVGAAVVVSFSTPRAVDAVRADMRLARYNVAALQGTSRDSVKIAAATRLRGRITAMRNDSVLLALTEVTGSLGNVSFDRKHSAVIVRDSNVSVRVLSRTPSRSQGIFFGALAGAMVLFGMFLLALPRS